MPLDVMVAATVIDRWIAVPLIAAVWAFGHGSSQLDGDFLQAFAVASLYGAIGVVVRRVISSEIHDLRSERRLRQQSERRDGSESDRM